MFLRRWLDAYDRRLLTRQERTPAQTDWTAWTIASVIMDVTHPFRLARMDHELAKFDQALSLGNPWLIDGGYPDDTPVVDDRELVEAVGYSGAMETGRSKLRPWLKDQVDGYIRQWSNEKWKLVVFYLEGTMLQFRIERI